MISRIVLIKGFDPLRPTITDTVVADSVRIKRLRKYTAELSTNVLNKVRRDRYGPEKTGEFMSKATNVSVTTVY
jgi:hypothetical protein